MDNFILFSILISLAAVFSYLNVRLFKLPTGISLLLMGTILAMLLITAGELSPSFTEYVKHRLSAINFSEFLLGILLSFLLFAGSLHIHYNDLKKSTRSILSFATIGVLLSAFFIATIVFYLFHMLNIQVSYIACLLFGALISPTDPIAVLGILRKANIPESVETKITGESLFNDGIGVVVFATIMAVASKGIDNVSTVSVLILFIQEAIGGIAAGFVIGFAGYKLMKSIDHFQTEILISLSMVMGGYSLCHYLHISGPLAMVVAGLITGNKGKKQAMSDTTKEYLEKFWEITDEVLNAILFIMMGLQLVVINFQVGYLLPGVITALFLVLSRYASLWIPAFIFGLRKTLEPHTITIMTWGGLRGGISIALALSLPANMSKDIFVQVTFVIVLFSILVQGPTINKLIKRLNRQS